MVKAVSPAPKKSKRKEAQTPQERRAMWRRMIKFRKASLRNLKQRQRIMAEKVKLLEIEIKQLEEYIDASKTDSAA